MELRNSNFINLYSIAIMKCVCRVACIGNVRCIKPLTICGHCHRGICQICQSKFTIYIYLCGRCNLTYCCRHFILHSTVYQSANCQDAALKLPTFTQQISQSYAKCLKHSPHAHLSITWSEDQWVPIISSSLAHSKIHSISNL
jgi:hypothetical protein